MCSYTLMGDLINCVSPAHTPSPLEQVSIYLILQKKKGSHKNIHLRQPPLITSQDSQMLGSSISALGVHTLTRADIDVVNIALYLHSSMLIPKHHQNNTRCHAAKTHSNSGAKSWYQHDDSMNVRIAVAP